MFHLYQKIIEKLEKGEKTVLVTVTQAKGSTPRKSGAYMLVGETGRIWGTVGGGNLEYQALCYIASNWDEISSTEKHFLLEIEGKDSLNMACGGQVWLYFYVIDSKEKAEFAYQGLKFEENNVPYYLEISKGYRDYFCQDGCVYIFGAGHLGIETAKLLNHVGFKCIVMDDREEYLEEAGFTREIITKQVDFANLENTISIAKQDYIIVATRGHSCDIDVERFALKTEADYIGVVGSRKKIKYVNEVLLKEGFTREELDRVVTPIGLDIGSETPGEIAVSIAAQLIQIRHNRRK